LPRASPPRSVKEKNKTHWPPLPSPTKYPTLKNDWTTTETQSPSQQVTSQRGMSSMTIPGY
jgi:hypothetical protein